MIDACHLDSSKACLFVKNSQKEDARIWFTFLDRYNGHSPFSEPSWSDNDILDLVVPAVNVRFSRIIGQPYAGRPESWDPDIQKDITNLNKGLFF